MLSKYPKTRKKMELRQIESETMELSQMQLKMFQMYLETTMKKKQKRKKAEEKQKWQQKSLQHRNCTFSNLEWEMANEEQMLQCDKEEHAIDRAAVLFGSSSPFACQMTSLHDADCSVKKKKMTTMRKKRRKPLNKKVRIMTHSCSAQRSSSFSWLMSQQQKHLKHCHQPMRSMLPLLLGCLMEG